MLRGFKCRSSVKKILKPPCMEIEINGPEKNKYLHWPYQRILCFNSKQVL